MTVPRFWREIPQRYNLQASTCGTCKATHFPPREVCPTCRRASIGKMTRAPLSGRGTVVEWTRVHKPAPGFELQVPYVIALIQTPEGPVLTGQVVDGETGLAAGAQVRSVFRRIGSDGEAGVIHYGTKWVIATPATEPVQGKPKETKGSAKRDASTKGQESGKGKSGRRRFLGRSKPQA